LGSGQIDPLVDDRYGLDDLPEALDCLKNRRSVGKLILRVAN
jgi:NADPH:quinone reductase-like Zn-dependent oxidoreductase